MVTIRASDTGPCGGNCCRAFTISVPDGFAWIDAVRQDPDASKENRTIADMLVPLGTYRTHPLNGKFYDRPNQIWTCRHFDPETRLCRSYDDRPEMCRTYPSRWSDNLCGFRGCQLTGKRVPPPGSGLACV